MSHSGHVGEREGGGEAYGLEKLKSGYFLDWMVDCLILRGL